MEQTASRARGVAQAALAMITLGTLAAVSAVIAHYPIYGGQAVRYAVATAFLLGVARWRRRRRPVQSPPVKPDALLVRPTVRESLLFAVLAVTGLAGFNLCMVEGTHYTSPATIGTVIGSAPIVFALIGPLMERRRPTARLVTAAVVVTIGAGLTSGLCGGRPLGLLLAVGALVGQVAFSLLAVPLLPKFGAILVSAYSSAAAAMILFAIGLTVDGTAVLRRPTVGEAVSIAYLATFVTITAFILWYDAISLIGADLAGLFSGLIPISALATTAFLGIRAIRPAELAGSVLVGIGVVVGMGDLGASRSRSEPAA
ncbi:DMT family transporter [Actinoallomurus purpureus]|uniref:DMT family transporter n=1 Tax=Actinoallomurus purpureus TaxID=478114 RepID=UPI0020920B98|nr:DMT family transporter [Actinoallomurus purpureus]MCO6006658.1 DMT family transporter [Actinoallomurus purpureus]